VRTASTPRRSAVQLFVGEENDVAIREVLTSINPKTGYLDRRRDRARL